MIVIILFLVILFIIIEGDGKKWRFDPKGGALRRIKPERKKQKKESNR